MTELNTGTSTCKNEIIQYVPTTYDVKAVKGVCGQTGIYGEPVFCSVCEGNGRAKREQDRISNSERDDW